MGTETFRNQKSWALALFVAPALALPRIALAATIITVGSGTPESCTELALRNAIAQAASVPGPTIRFACGANPVTILLTQPNEYEQPVHLAPPNNTTIDGGGLVTLDGGFYPPASIISVAPDTTVALKNIGITGAWFYSAVRNEGDLTVRRTTFLANWSAIENHGTLTVKDSLFTGNGLSYWESGGIGNFGSATVEGCAFLDNGGNEGAIYNGGTFTLRNSTLSGNGGEWGAGGMTNGGTLNVENSQFFSNRGFTGGGIRNSGDLLTVKDTTFAGNSGLGPGAGGITNWQGTVIVTNSDFSGNYGTYGGGMYSAGTLIIRNSIVQDNTAGDGGGLTTEGTTTILNSTITGNIATGTGGGIYIKGGPLPLIIRTSVTGNVPNNIASVFE